MGKLLIRLPFQIDGITTEEFTYAQLKARSLRYAECLQAEGIREGDAVGLCSENRIDFTCVLFGAMYLGATVAPLNLTYSESKLQFVLSNPRLIGFIANDAQLAIWLKVDNKPWR